MLATLRVGFQNLFEETYSSRVSLVEDKKVEAIASNTTVFKTLKNKWIFEPLKRELYDHPLLLKYTETQNIRDYPLTRIDFLVQFEFQNVVYQ
jgi:ribosome-associated toxin RatA of RatAB toxin-antitoxin module